MKEGCVETLTGRLPPYAFVSYTVGSSDIKRRYDSMLIWVQLYLLLLEERVNG